MSEPPSKKARTDSFKVLFQKVFDDLDTTGVTGAVRGLC